jgi:hypothetical protein
MDALRNNFLCSYIHLSLGLHDCGEHVAYFSLVLNFALDLIEDVRWDVKVLAYDLLHGSLVSKLAIDYQS